uniref:Uncharacterized protein n=1 Tax=Setaria viridis TaxID=4556 RepID=A0A4U6TQM4_SETVI|nr:hypothetical protein SEVIR_7G057309v2 [Setaria viridis]
MHAHGVPAVKIELVVDLCSSSDEAPTADSPPLAHNSDVTRNRRHLCHSLASLCYAVLPLLRVSTKLSKEFRVSSSLKTSIFKQPNLLTHRGCLIPILADSC